MPALQEAVPGNRRSIQPSYGRGAGITPPRRQARRHANPWPTRSRPTLYFRRPRPPAPTPHPAMPPTPPARRLTLTPLALAATLLLTPALPSCQSAYYATMEKFGVHKRDILVDRVEEGRDAQMEAKTEIVSALDAFKAVTSFQGGELEAVYERLSDRYESSADAVDEVKKRIASIDDVAAALFKEWTAEIDGMQDPELKRQSRDMLDDTKSRCAKVTAAMKAAEAKMEPVLTRLKDHVTFLKHNLNAKAIASLQKNLFTIETDVSALVADMEKSIAEAESFISSMKE